MKKDDKRDILCEGLLDGVVKRQQDNPDSFFEGLYPKALKTTKRIGIMGG